MKIQGKFQKHFSLSVRAFSSLYQSETKEPLNMHPFNNTASLFFCMHLTNRNFHSHTFVQKKENDIAWLLASAIFLSAGLHCENFHHLFIQYNDTQWRDGVKKRAEEQGIRMKRDAPQQRQLHYYQQRCILFRISFSRPVSINEIKMRFSECIFIQLYMPSLLLSLLKSSFDIQVCPVFDVLQYF